MYAGPDTACVSSKNPVQGFRFRCVGKANAPKIDRGQRRWDKPRYGCAPGFGESNGNVHVIPSGYLVGLNPANGRSQEEFSRPTTRFLISISVARPAKKKSMT